MAEFGISDYSESLNLFGPSSDIAALAETARDDSLADYSYQVIMKRIREFEGGLNDDEEVAVRLASFGSSVTMSVTDISYSNPSTLVFYGYVGDQRSMLVQHMSQLNFLLLAVKKEDPSKPSNPIGFH